MVIPAGSLSKTFNVRLIDDVFDEPSEQFAVFLGTPVNGSIQILKGSSGGSGGIATPDQKVNWLSVITIVDNDESQSVSFSTSNQEVFEGRRNDKTAIEVRLELSKPSEHDTYVTLCQRTEARRTLRKITPMCPASIISKGSWLLFARRNRRNAEVQNTRRQHL